MTLTGAIKISKRFARICRTEQKLQKNNRRKEYFTEFQDFLSWHSFAIEDTDFDRSIEGKEKRRSPII
ncbi:hypothetical protein NIES208_16860 [[Limnothrix rosea] IAM M-220]|nr:hypothetical protein NIES208_16860 [[Limnothrix rosea] IAM M-220]